MLNINHELLKLFLAQESRATCSPRCAQVMALDSLLQIADKYQEL